MVEVSDEELLKQAVLRLSGVVLGLVCGVVTGLLVFVATNWLVLKGGPVVGPHLALLGQFFIGYTVTFAGSVIGLGYGFACGFIAGWILARLYNWIVALRSTA
jgi:hypothetical protein